MSPREVQVVYPLPPQHADSVSIYLLRSTISKTHSNLRFISLEHATVLELTWMISLFMTEMQSILSISSLTSDSVL